MTHEGIGGLTEESNYVEIRDGVNGIPRIVDIGYAMSIVETAHKGAYIAKGGPGNIDYTDVTRIDMWSDGLYMYTLKGMTYINQDGKKTTWPLKRTLIERVKLFD